tara:strand:- start:607 stop:1104 length:498 start_codon:yes stop_codon:yes gene_type:complete
MKQQFLGPAEAKLRMMNFKTLQKEVIIRGYPFDKVSTGDHTILASFYIKNFKADTKESLLSEYDDYIEDLLKNRGLQTAFTHPQLRYAFVSADKEDIVKTEEPKKIKEKKEKTVDGIYKGTKKALTFKLAKEGLTKTETIEKVLETFPDASPKSMGIWYNKALKE